MAARTSCAAVRRGAQPRVVGADGAVGPRPCDRGRAHRAVVAGAGADAAPPGVPVDDVGERVIAPGLVDCHVHVNEPGRTEWEGFETATRAAAAGGVTTLVDMPLNCIPVTTTRAALEEKLRAADGQLLRRRRASGAASSRATRASWPGWRAAGVLGCKAFLVHSGIDEFPNATEADLRAAMPVLRDAGPAAARARRARSRRAERRAATIRARYARYLRSRPRRLGGRGDRAAGPAVPRDRLRRARRAPVVGGVAAARSRAAKARGAAASRVETCPHYLCLDAEEIPDGATAVQVRAADPRAREPRGAVAGAGSRA